MQRQVPTPTSPLPSPNPTISHSGRTGFKQRLSTTSENYPPNLPLSKGRTSTSRKPTDSTTESTISTSKKFKSFKDISVRTTPSFKRNVGSGTEDNRISSSTTEVRWGGGKACWLALYSFAEPTSPTYCNVILKYEWWYWKFICSDVTDNCSNISRICDTPHH